MMRNLGICKIRCSSQYASAQYVEITSSWNIVVDNLVRGKNAVDNWAYTNRLTPNDTYMGLTATLTSKRCILYIYLTNIGTEYFKHAL